MAPNVQKSPKRAESPRTTPPTSPTRAASTPIGRLSSILDPFLNRFDDDSTAAILIPKQLGQHFDHHLHFGIQKRIIDRLPLAPR